MPVDTAAIKKANLPVILVLGGPGAGKGTQCAKIKAKYGYTHLSMGQLMRDEVKNNTERAKKLKDALDKGELVANDVTCDLMKEQMAKNVQTNKPFLLHGFPRNKDQLKCLEEFAAPAKAILVLDCPEAKMLERLTARAKTGARTDDKPEVVKKRIEVFNKDTKPLIDELINSRKAVKINAADDVEKVFGEICKELDKIQGGQGGQPGQQSQQGQNQPGQQGQQGQQGNKPGSNPGQPGQPGQGMNQPGQQGQNQPGQQQNKPGSNPGQPGQPGQQGQQQGQNKNQSQERGK